MEYIRDAHGRNLFRINGNCVESTSGRILYRIEGDCVINASGKIVYRIDGNYVTAGGGGKIICTMQQGSIAYKILIGSALGLISLPKP